MAPAAPAAAAAAAAAAARRPRRTMRLPNGLWVRYASKRDVLFLHQEVYQQRCYLRKGLALPSGGTVLDVGANIGFFSLLAAEELGPQGLVVSCEPLAPIFDCLLYNIAAHRRWRQKQPQAEQQQQQQQQHQQQIEQQQIEKHQRPPPQQRQERRPDDARAAAPPAPIVALNVGVSDGTQPVAEFTFFPRVSGWSTMRPAQSSDIQADMEGFLENALSSREAAAAAGLPPLEGAVGTWLRAAAPRRLYDAARRAMVALMLVGARRYACPLLSVRQIVREQGLGLDSRGIDLLKVDVERAELDVLRGVGDCWPLVRQVALEVHSENLEAVLAVLKEEGGFRHVVVEQDPMFTGTCLTCVYARRE